MTRDYTIYLFDIIDNMAQAESFIGNMTFDQFLILQTYEKVAF